MVEQHNVSSWQHYLSTALVLVQVSLPLTANGREFLTRIAARRSISPRAARRFEQVSRFRSCVSPLLVRLPVSVSEIRTSTVVWQHSSSNVNWRSAQGSCVAGRPYGVRAVSSFVDHLCETGRDGLMRRRGSSSQRRPPGWCGPDRRGSGERIR